MLKKESRVIKSYDDVKNKANLNMMITAALSMTSLALAFMAFTKTVEVVVVPPNFTEEIRVADNQANEHYKVRWAFATAALAGNITGKNAEFVVEQIGNMLSPYLKEYVLPGLVKEAQIIKVREASQRFTVEDAIYDPERDIVWIWGWKEFIVKGRDPDRQRWTYEFRIEPFNGRPAITHFDAYPDTPRAKDKTYKVEPQPLLSDDLKQAFETTNPDQS